MRKYLFIFVLLLLSTSSYSQKKRTLFVSVESKYINENDCHIIEDIFHEKLLGGKYTIRTFSNEGTFAKARLKELAFQESGEVPYEDVKSTQRMLAADDLMVVVVEKLQNGDFYFRTKFFNLETGQLINTARYPEAKDKTDKPIKGINDVRLLEEVTLKLLIRLGINDNEDVLSKELQNVQDNISGDINRENLKALAYSIIPGVGLMTKGHYIEGACYLVADVALIGGGIGALSQSNKQSDLIKTGFLDRDQMLQAQKKRDNAKVASYCCFGAAAVVYVVNLYRSYVAKPKNKSWVMNITPEMAPRICGKSNLYMNFALTYSF